MDGDLHALVEESTELGTVSLLAIFAPNVTFASHQNDIAVLTDLSIHNGTSRDLENVVLTLTSDPPVLGTRNWTIDRIAAGGEVHPRDRHVPLAGGLLDKLTDRVRTDVRLELKQGDALLAKFTTSIAALARNEWGGSRYVPELLAAFATPNDLAVSRLLKEASNLLASSGKQGSLEGYQAGSRSRVWEIMSGIWAAVVARGLTYAVPPASFELTGQKVRLPSDIETTGLATCLDTALLFAACFEQAGLYPVVVFTEGHAFAGAWLQPQHLPSLTTDDPQVLRKALALNELVLFETTMATAGHALPFSKAIAEANRQMAEEHDAKFVCAIDIHQARRRGIQPLSTLAVEAGRVAGADQVRAAPALDEVPDLPGFDLGQDADDGAPKTPKERLDRWKRDLLDLSKRNRLLNLRATTTAVPLFCPDPARLEDLIADGKRLKLIPPPERASSSADVDATLHHLRTGDDRDVEFALEALDRSQVVANTDPRSLEKGVIELYRKAKADLEEGGSNTLFLALGTLRWSPRSDAKSHYRAPMILLPVRLERASAKSSPYLFRHDDEATFNLTLLEMLSQDFGIDMPDLAGELPSDGRGIDVPKVWNRVRQRIKDVPGFEVVPEVVLSTFSFAKYLMWKDLSDRTETLKRTPFVRHLIDHPREPYAGGASFLEPKEIDSRIDPATLFAPLHADSSQIVAIHASGQDGDFVLEGPPGTGKSETIGNIIAHNLGLGRRVLFVSEKMAALDVVHRRLSKAGLGDFCLELHSTKANKKGVLQQLDAAWKKRDALSKEEWEAKAGELKCVRDRLNGLTAALHTPGPAGISARDAIGRTLRFGDIHAVELDWPQSLDMLNRVDSPRALADLIEKARALGRQFSQITPDDVQTFAEFETSDWSNSWQASVSKAAREVAQSIETFGPVCQDLLRRLGLEAVTPSRDEIEALSILAGLLPACVRTNLAFALEGRARDIIDQLRALSQALKSYREKRRQIPEAYPEDRIPDQPVGSFIAEREEAQARSFLFRAGAVRAVRAKIAAAYGISLGQVSEPETHLEALRELAEARKALSNLEAGLPAGSPWKGVTTDLAHLDEALLAAETLRATALRLAQDGRELEQVRSQLTRVLCEERDLLDAGSATDSTARRYQEEARALLAALTTWSGIKGEAGSEVGTRDLAAIASEARSVAGRERRLNVWCNWVAARREATQAGLGCLVQALEAGRVSHDQIAEALRTAFCRWSAPLLIDSNDALRRFSSVDHEALIRSFCELDEEVSSLTAGHIRALLSSQVPSRNSVTAGHGFGVLSREIQKKSQHMPVRRLMSEMGSALTTLTPCLMMSPLSVAQFLPAEAALFDLIVFDEASQITVYDAVGAIARGRRCIVVGDPKQMPPTNFFGKAAGEEGGDEELDSDLESILDEALAARVPLHRLTGHYRSRHESLITFSNYAYYDGELVTYPAADTRDTVVSLKKVDGIYGRGKAQTNPIEAKAVVDEVVSRLKDPTRNHQSIGIVTLNAKQQDLILNLLDDARRANPELEKFFRDDVSEPVFVKNLETVQGDQRDVILLSICFGPTEPGSPTMSMNLGPLNGKGGQRRLNVAITRANSEVMVFTSFDPSMLDLSRTSSEAVRDLKHYLEFAQRGPAALGAGIRGGAGTSDYDSDFEMAVAEALRGRGWTVRTQIGVSKFRVDLGIVHPDAPGSYLAGVECDGATYHSSPSARDRDRVRHIILEQLGWRLVRLWSTDWFVDRDTALDRLDQALTRILEESRQQAEEARRQSEEAQRVAEEAAAAAAQQGQTEPQVEVEDVVQPDRTSETEDMSSADDSDPITSEAPPPEPWVDRTEPLAARMVSEAAAPQAPVSPQSPGLGADPARFHDPDYQPVIRQKAVALIESEGPILFKRLSDLIAREHGFSRTGRAISSAVWSAVKDLEPRSRTADENNVFWSTGSTPQDILPFRGLTLAGRARDWDEVPLPERFGLIRSLKAKGEVDLARAAAGAIGYRRVTESFRADIERLAMQLPELESALGGNQEAGS